MAATYSNVLSQLQIEGVQTVPPLTVTDPRETRQFLGLNHQDSDLFRGCLNIVLYYKKSRQEDSGWLVAGWIKESLARVLVDQPLLSGRLRRGEDDGKGELEIVANDSGARLIEAKISMTLDEFLDLKGKRDKSEAELVFWKDIDEQNPQFSPLFYVQVTNFQCGGYSVGISCSLLLADLLIMDNFIWRWADIQKQMHSKNGETKFPIFYLPDLKATTSSTFTITPSAPTKNDGRTMIVKIAGERIDFKESYKTLAWLCIEEAEGKLGSKLSCSEFSLMVKESSKVMKVQKCKKYEIVKSHLNMKSSIVSWGDLEMNELAFFKGNNPARVSHWIGSVDEGVMLLIPCNDGDCSTDDQVKILVTVPSEMKI